MPIRVLAIVFVCVSLASPQPKLPTPAGRVLTAWLTAKMNDQLKEDRFSGAVLIGHRGRIVFEKAVGLANRESRTPNTLDTQFRNGSMNKMFTATAVMQLVEAGKLSLDDTVGKVMTDYPNVEVARKVTIRHLLGHTGGTGDFFGPEFVKHRLTRHALFRAFRRRAGTERRSQDIPGIRLRDRRAQQPRSAGRVADGGFDRRQTATRTLN
jgi:CubicO group peptidase (beta-lactamase class C family)